MMDIFGLTPFSGVIGDARALSKTEIQNQQIAQAPLMRQAEWPSSYLLGAANYPQPELKPLDERFADFKVRLAAAIDRLNQIKANQAGS